MFIHRPGHLAAASVLALASCSSQHAGSAYVARTSDNNLSFVPEYPGAGKSGADAPLTSGKLCDYVPGPGTAFVTARTACFFTQGQTNPAATIEQVLECVDERDAIHLRLTFDPAFVDNTYGEYAIGWNARGKKGPGGPAGARMPAPPAGMPGGPGAHMPPAGPGGMAGPGGPGGMSGHTWMDLVGSDHAELAATDADGRKVIQFKLDYISQSSRAPSGYETLGVSGGDGRMIFGSANDLVDYTTSIDRNLNERGYGDYTLSSPETDASYTPNIDTPNWDYRVVYEAWIDIDAFGDAGFGGATIELVHASPSKGDSDTLIVKRGDCPCQRDGGCEELCELDGPDDTHCIPPGVPPDRHGDTPPTAFCTEHPEDTSCTPF